MDSWNQKKLIAAVQGINFWLFCLLLLRMIETIFNYLTKPL